MRMMMVNIGAMILLESQMHYASKFTRRAITAWMIHKEFGVVCEFAEYVSNYVTDSFDEMCSRN